VGVYCSLLVMYTTAVKLMALPAAVDDRVFVDVQPCNKESLHRYVHVL
jgi:hypothetical protein